MIFHSWNSGAVLSVAAASLMFVSTGCATKKHVRQTVGPVEARVSQAEETSRQQQAAIGELENSVSRADERAIDAERKASAAGDAARAAGESAQVAHNRADSAHTLAESTRSRLSELAANIDNFKLVTSENVLFRVNSHRLSPEAQEQLDAAVAQLQESPNYVLEIQGYTDSSGSAAHNLELSRRRADAVVRYLTTKHNVPLRKINVLGVGQDDPTADNRTREGRAQARRVEIKVYALDLGETSAGNVSGSVPQNTSGVSGNRGVSDNAQNR